MYVLYVQAVNIIAVPLQYWAVANPMTVLHLKTGGFMKKTRCFINKYGIFWGIYLLELRISIYLFTCLE